ncbi:MAG: tetratricopeptide repeat protein [Actinomycetia bacterium]|nr:tetratricopeptide repeat protein [Actinomycetes bacterium]
MVRIELLGPFRVTADGADITPAGQREQVALAALALSGAEGISTDRLADELYGERESTDPRNAVQAVVSRLRKGLGDHAGVLETAGAGYRLDPGMVEVDVTEVQALIGEARRDGDPTRGRGSSEHAVSLWRGRTLGDLEGGELLDAERHRLDDIRATAVELVLEHRIDQGDHQAAVADLEAAVRDEPLRERRWELLMLALYRSGRQVDALRAFQRARARLAEQLGLDPGPALTQLEQKILTHDAELDTGAAAPPRAVDGPAVRPLPSGTVSVLLCDVEGSVKRWELEPTGTGADVAAMLDRWATAVEAQGGVVVKTTGDGLLAAFDDPAAALGAAVAAQQAQRAAPLSVRAAVHTATARPVDGDYRGALVNRCARLLDLAHGGQVLTTGVTAQLAGTELGADLRLRELGRHWLRDVAEPVDVLQVDAEGLATSFPALRSAGPSGLPRLRNPLLGRAPVLDDIVTAVGEHPLVTLVGPGGVGKTSMALAVGWEVANHRRVCFVDLAGVGSVQGVPARVADALVTDEESDQGPAARIIDRLRTSTDLVVVDNAEHLIGAVAALIDEVLAHDLKGSFLVTSRQLLTVTGEQAVPLAPLALPDAGADLRVTGSSPSVRLFLDRAQAARSDLEVSDGLLPIVAHICRRLDGLPLAIELAAGRASVLSIEDIASRLDDQIRLLRQVPATREGRHRSIEAVVTFSLDQLEPVVRRLFGALGAIVGEFGLEHAEAAGTGYDIDPLDVLDGVAELAAVSLIAVQPGGSRYRMLEPVRQLALSELEDSSRAPLVRAALIGWVRDRLEEGHNRRDSGRAAALEFLSADLDLIRAVIGWVVEDDQPEIAGQLAVTSSWLFLTLDPFSGDRLLGDLADSIDRAEHPLAWARSIVAWGITTATHPQPGVAEGIVEAIEILDAEGDPDRGLARVAAAFAQTEGLDIELPLRFIDEADRIVSSDDVWSRAIVDMSVMAIHVLVSVVDPPRADMALAIDRGQRAVAAFRSLDDHWALGATLGELGRLHQNRGEVNEAEACYLESLELFDDREYHGNHHVLTALGRLASDRGQHDQARRYHLEALAVAEPSGSPGCRAESVAGLGHAAAAAGDLEEAIARYREAVAIQHQFSIMEQGGEGWADELARLEDLAQWRQVGATVPDDADSKGD